jgi:uncharacterized protein (DUF427 family)
MLAQGPESRRMSPVTRSFSITRQTLSPVPAEWSADHMKAVWKGKVIAESDQTVVVEGNHYFPVQSVSFEFLRESDKHTICPWKGQASYYDISVDGEVNQNAAWYYPQPKEAARQIQGYIAFWKGVQVREA